MTTIRRLGRAGALALALGLAAPANAPAQDEFETVGQEGEGGEGKPIFGYLACGAGCIAVIFLLCISARR